MTDRRGASQRWMEVILDKYYFYAALAERRVRVDGPTYLRERADVLVGLDAAADLFTTRRSR